MTDAPIHYYRYVDDWYETSGTAVVLQTLVLHKKTPKGAWVCWAWDNDGHWKKFILDGKGRRYAYQSKDDALNSFRIRKLRQIQRCAASIERAEEALLIIKSPEFDKDNDGYA